MEKAASIDVAQQGKEVDIDPAGPWGRHGAIIPALSRNAHATFAARPAVCTLGQSHSLGETESPLQATAKMTASKVNEHGYLRSMSDCLAGKPNVGGP